MADICYVHWVCGLTVYTERLRDGRITTSSVLDNVAPSDLHKQLSRNDAGRIFYLSILSAVVNQDGLFVPISVEYLLFKFSVLRSPLEMAYSH